MKRFNFEKFGNDVQKAINGNSLRPVAKEIGISHSSLHKIINGSKTDVDSLVKLLQWLNKPFEHYLKKGGAHEKITQCR